MISIMLDVVHEFQRLPGREIVFAAGETIFRRGDPVCFLHLINGGTATLMRFGEAGVPMVMQRATSRMFLAESSLFSDVYHCDASAQVDTRAHRVHVGTVRQAMKERPGFAVAFSAYLAREVQRMRIRSETLAIRTVGGRLDAWLSLNGSALPARGGWRNLAVELGVSPEALYREMARRKPNRPT